jgi:microcystin-dependent protein
VAQPYIGEIRMFAGNFAPAGWAFCEGQTVPIAENDTLFTLIGTTYGGDGQENFRLPDLRGRLPLHQGTGSDGTTYPLADSAGVSQVTLSTQQVPVHTHALAASTSPGSAPSPTGNLFAEGGSFNAYRPGPASVALAPQTVQPAGGSQPHSNEQPYLCVDFIISLFGLFPYPT